MPGNPPSLLLCSRRGIRGQLVVDNACVAVGFWCASPIWPSRMCVRICGRLGTRGMRSGSRSALTRGRVQPALRLRRQDFIPGIWRHTATWCLVPLGGLCFRVQHGLLFGDCGGVDGRAPCFPPCTPSCQTALITFQPPCASCQLFSIPLQPESVALAIDCYHSIPVRSRLIAVGYPQPQGWCAQVSQVPFVPLPTALWGALCVLS